MHSIETLNKQVDRKTYLVYVSYPLCLCSQSRHKNGLVLVKEMMVIHESISMGLF